MDILNKNSYDAIKKIAENYARKSLNDGEITQFSFECTPADTNGIITSLTNIYVGYLKISADFDSGIHDIRFRNQNNLVTFFYQFNADGNRITKPSDEFSLVMFSGLRTTTVTVGSDVWYVEFIGYVFGNQ